MCRCPASFALTWWVLLLLLLAVVVVVLVVLTVMLAVGLCDKSSGAVEGVGPAGQVQHGFQLRCALHRRTPGTLAACRLLPAACRLQAGFEFFEEYGPYHVHLTKVGGAHRTASPRVPAMPLPLPMLCSSTTPPINIIACNCRLYLCSASLAWLGVVWAGSYTTTPGT